MRAASQTRSDVGDSVYFVRRSLQGGAPRATQRTIPRLLLPSYHHRIGKKNRIRDDHSMAVLRADESGPCLNVIDPAFQAGNADRITQLEWLLQERKDSGEKVLQDILESKSNRDASYAQHFDEVAGLEGRRHDRKSD